MIGREDDRDTAVLNVSTDAATALSVDEIAETARAVLRVRADVRIVPDDTLPEDGRHIEDTRAHD